MNVQAFGTRAAVKGVDECIVGWFVSLERLRLGLPMLCLLMSAFSDALHFCDAEWDKTVLSRRTSHAHPRRRLSWQSIGP